MFATTSLAISMCGLATAIVALIGAMGDDEKSTGVPSTIDITLSDSCNGMGKLGGNTLPLHQGCSLDHAKHIILTDEEESNWCRFVFLQSIAFSSSSLQRVPEETSLYVRTGASN